MKGTLIGMLIGFSLGLTASAQQGTADQRGKGGASAGSERETGTPQLGRSDDRAAASLETHHDLAKNEVTGKVVRVDPGTVWIDHMGAVIPLKIDANTRFESAGIARPKDLKEGQEVRVSFRVQNKTTNVADSIWLEGAPATGTQPSTSLMESHKTVTSPKQPDAMREGSGTKQAPPAQEMR